MRFTQRVMGVDNCLSIEDGGTVKISIVVPTHDGSTAQSLYAAVKDERLPYEVIAVSENGADIYVSAVGHQSQQQSEMRHFAARDRKLSPSAALEFGAANSSGDIVFTVPNASSLARVLQRCRGLQQEYSTGFPPDTLRLPVVSSRGRLETQAQSDMSVYGSSHESPSRWTSESERGETSGGGLVAAPLPKPKTLIVVPITNERANFEDFVYAVLGVLPWADILVIDDNSPDGTGIVADTLAMLIRQVRVVHRPARLGLGTAYILGFQYAIAHGYDLVCQMDANFSHDPEALPKLIELAHDADLVIGSCYMRNSELPNWTPGRRLMNGFGNLVAKAVLGMAGSDCTSRFRCYRTQALAAMHLDRATRQDSVFEIEMAYAVWQSGYQVRETPITLHQHGGTAEILPPKALLEAFWWLIKTRLHGSPVVADPEEATHPLPVPGFTLAKDGAPAQVPPASWSVRFATAAVCLLTVIGYMLWGHLLYTLWRVPVGNTGVYAQGLSEIATGHLLGYSPFVGKDIWADAGELVAYLIAPLYALLGINSLWLVQGLSVAASEALAVCLARSYKLAVWQQLGILAVVACNPFVIANFVTSWDFDILFVPAVLGLVLLSQHSTSVRRLGVIGIVTLLTCTIKDEVPVVLAFWGVAAWIFRIGDRRAAATITVISAMYYVALQFGLTVTGLQDSQIASHYSQIGGANGIAGMVHFALQHPLRIASQLYSKRGYFFDLIAASGGAILLDGSGIVCLLVGVMNALGDGTLGEIMAQSNLEFTLINVPFLFISLTRLNARLRGPILSFAIIFAFTALYFGANSLPSTAAAAPPSEITQLNKLEAWYWQQPVRPAFYGQQAMATHFLGSPVTAVDDDSLNATAAQAQHRNLPMPIVFDQLLTSYDASPNGLLTMTAGLVASGDMTSCADAQLTISPRVLP